VKILDFGLAKLIEPSGALAAAGSLPTVAVETQPGMMLGTMGYMAPEQVRGHAADHRSDIFSFGAILYEMLSGQRAFRGATAADTITAILDKDPADLPVAERHIPPALARVVDRCLEKSPAARFQSTHDLAFALEGVSGHSDASVMAATPAHAAPKRNRREQLAWGIAALLALGLAAVILQSMRRPVEQQTAIRFPIRPPQLAAFAGGGGLSLAISPDGRRIVFGVSPAGGGSQTLWLRSIDGLEARQLPGTEHGGNSSAFWSPDSRFLAFAADNKLKKLDVSGGAPQTLCDLPGPPTGGTWGRDGVIVFGSGQAGLFRVPAAGGRPTAATTLASGEVNHRRPSFLPDGRRFTYVAQPGNAVYVGSLDSPTVTKVLSADSQAVYSAGHLMFVRQATLFAQPFDAERLVSSGEAVPVAEQVATNAPVAGAAFAASKSGSVVYVTGGGAAIADQLTWFDRSGKATGTEGATADFRGIELSPDERHLAEHPHEAPGTSGYAIFHGARPPG